MAEFGKDTNVRSNEMINFWEQKLLEGLERPPVFNHTTPMPAKRKRWLKFKWTCIKLFRKLTPFVIISRKKLDEIYDQI